ncbi:acetaldehyde dehydrogenase [Actinomycetota bacterium]|nr:acetaldehyde dehydrogenase [Actinomycetota bacterium]
MSKVKCAILGTGNIGTDLLMKIGRSELLEVGIFAGRRPDSDGMLKAKQLGIFTSTESIDAIVQNPELCDVVFDCTSASSHLVHAPILEDLGKFTIDLTPAHVGQFCVPVLNLSEGLKSKNVNMITCGGQATIPILTAISDALGGNLDYIETVSVIASKSAGVGTRNNIDEFTQTTKQSILDFTGCKQAKSIIILNPAEPPIRMHNTIYVPFTNPDMPTITYAVNEMASKVREYVPGYRIAMQPIYENGNITVGIEVNGAGDYLPKYSGNLDIINCAAVHIAEQYARSRSGVHPTLVGPAINAGKAVINAGKADNNEGGVNNG